MNCLEMREELFRRWASESLNLCELSTERGLFDVLCPKDANSLIESEIRGCYIVINTVNLKRYRDVFCCLMQ